MSAAAKVAAALALSGLAVGLSFTACSGDKETGPDLPPAQPAPGIDIAEPSSEWELTPPTRSASSPFVTPTNPDLEKTREVLGTVVDTYAGDPDNPWAVAHGILARGEGFTLTNGEPAVGYLYERYAEPAEIQGRKLVAFPRSKDGVDVEPHTDLVLKALTEANVSPETVVTVDGHDFEIGDTWEHTLRTTFLSKVDGASSYDSPNDMPWGVQALALWAPPKLAWTSFEGTQMSLDELAKLMVHVLTSESEFMIRAMVSGQDFEKRKQGVFAYTCGGAHLLQGSAFVVARGFGGDAEREKMAVQGQLLFYRFPRELKLTQDGIAQNPQFELVLLAQQLKFVGHWIESVHKMMALELYTPTSVEQAQIYAANDALIATVKRLKAMGAFDNMPQLREKNPQLYLDLVGDSAHALKGLDLATGQGSVPY